MGDPYVAGIDPPARRSSHPGPARPIVAATIVAALVVLVVLLTRSEPQDSRAWASAQKIAGEIDASLAAGDIDLRALAERSTAAVQVDGAREVRVHPLGDRREVGITALVGDDEDTRCVWAFGRIGGPATTSGVRPVPGGYGEPTCGPDLIAWVLNNTYASERLDPSRAKAAVEILGEAVQGFARQGEPYDAEDLRVAMNQIALSTTNNPAILVTPNGRELGVGVIVGRTCILAWAGSKSAPQIWTVTRFSYIVGAGDPRDACTPERALSEVPTARPVASN